MEQFLKKQTVRVKKWFIERISWFKIFSNFTQSDRLPGEAYPGKLTYNASNEFEKIKIVLEYHSQAWKVLINEKIEGKNLLILSL